MIDLWKAFVMAEFGNHARIPLSFLKEKKRRIFIVSFYF